MLVDTLEEKRRAPKWQSHVAATILRHSTPPDVCRYAAGRHQYQQTQVASLRLSQVLSLFLHPDVQRHPTATARLSAVLMKAGHKDQQLKPVFPPSLPPWVFHVREPPSMAR